MKKDFLFIVLSTCLLAYHTARASVRADKPVPDSLKNSPVADEKLKFVILCFKLSPPYDEEIAALNKLAKEYDRYLSSIVIRDDNLNEYKDFFTRNEFKSLQDFISSKTAHQKQATSFPVILVLDKNGKIKNAWSGDKTDDGLKRDEFYIKIKAGLDAISQQK